MENEDILIDIRDSIYDVNDSINDSNDCLELIYSGDLQLISEINKVKLSLDALVVWVVFLLSGILFYHVFHVIFTKR